jgi:hypothetical protein
MGASQYPSRKGRDIGRTERGEWTKMKLLLILIAALMFIPYAAHAGVLENEDLDDYRYETFWPGGSPLAAGVIYSQSVQGDFCVEGCILKLLKTGQTVTMQPDDYIVISDGVMKRKGG